MTRKIFVTATNTDVGKTFATLTLMEMAAERGLRPVAFKPIETGVGEEGPADGLALLEAIRRLNPDAARLSIEEIVPCRYALPAAPFVAKAGHPIPWERIESALKRLETAGDILFIEGAGGLMVPIDEQRSMIDLPLLFDTHTTLLVAPGRLGAINDTLLSLEALQRRHIPYHLTINLRHNERKAFERATRPYYDAIGLPYRLLDQEAKMLLEEMF